MTLATLRSIQGVSVITLDDGKANVFSMPMIDAVNLALDAVPTDTGALLVRGRPRIFCAGFDLSVMQWAPPPEVACLVSAGLRLLLRLATFPRPVVAEVRGHAMALGALIALVGDHRIGSSGRYQICMTEVAKALPLPNFVPATVMHYLPTSHGRRLLLQSASFTPEQASAADILDELVSDQDIEARSLGRATELATLPSPAFGDAKRLCLQPIIDAATDFTKQTNLAFGVDRHNVKR